MDVTIRPAALRGTIPAIASKSMAHRLLIMAALCPGTTDINCNATSKDIVLYFRQNMPAFMVPRKLINLEKLPTLPNGKTDMQTLKGYFK